MLSCSLPFAASSVKASNGSAELREISCNHASMTGSGTLDCSVSLKTAPADELHVSLSSSNWAVRIPDTLIVPPKATAAKFTANVSSVANPRKVTLKASVGSTTETVALELHADKPRLTLATSITPSSYGGAVTFTATISEGPTGTVTFYNGDTSIGTGTIKGTTATLTTNSLIAGSHTITVRWSGNDHYEPVTSGAIIQVVKQATPAITWATPAAISSGTALSSTQLDASATIAGAFAYSPAKGTVLAAGSQTLSVTFTPANTTDYTTATKKVTLTVNQGTSTLSISATSVGFGNVVLNTPATQTVVLSSTGTAAVTVNSAALSGKGFTLSGHSFPVTLTPGQTATLDVEFDPTATGAATGQLTITSTSSRNSTATISLTGTGVATSYVVNLSWDAPSSSAEPIAGYIVKRASSGSSTYQSLITDDTETAYTDKTVESGQTYDYIVESFDPKGVVSAPTSPVAVKIP